MEMNEVDITDSRESEMTRRWGKEMVICLGLDCNFTLLI